MVKKITLLVLAAGESSRLGTPKQLLEVNGQTLLNFQLEKWESSKISFTCVVLGAFVNDIKSHLNGIKFVVANNWPKGMGASIATGISYLISINKIGDGVLIILCDQVQLDAYHIDKMIQIASDNLGKVVAAAYDNIVGVPALFPSRYVERLLNIDHSSGAGQLIKQLHKEGSVLTVEIPEAAIDIDTIEDYKKFLSS